MFTSYIIKIATTQKNLSEMAMLEPSVVYVPQHERT